MAGGGGWSESLADDQTIFYTLEMNYPPTQSYYASILLSTSRNFPSPTPHSSFLVVFLKHKGAFSPRKTNLPILPQLGSIPKHNLLLFYVYTHFYARHLYFTTFFILFSYFYNSIVIIGLKRIWNLPTGESPATCSFHLTDTGVVWVMECLFSPITTSDKLGPPLMDNYR